MKRTVIIIGAALLLVLTACGGSDSKSDTKTSTTGSVNTEPLKDADQVQRAEGVHTGKIGQAIPVHGLTATVTAITNDSRDPSDGNYVARINVGLHVTNETSKQQSALDVVVVCSNNTSQGSWYVQSTFNPNDAFPAKTFRDGNIILGVPTDCTNPTVRLQPTGFIPDGEKSAAEVPLPADVVAHLNDPKTDQ